MKTWASNNWRSKDKRALLCFVFFSATLFGAESKPLKSFNWLIQFSALYHYTSSAADNVSGAAFSRKLTNPLSFQVQFGHILWQHLYLGLAGDYWRGGRTYSLLSTEYKDELKYAAIGGELGFVGGNPRVYWMLTGVVWCPLVREVNSNVGGRYQNSTFKPMYSAHARIGIRLASFIAIGFGGGYRIANLGNLAGPTSTLIPGSGDLIMSGPFLGGQLAFTL